MHKRTVLALLLLSLVWLSWGTLRIDPKSFRNRMLIDDIAQQTSPAERRALGPFGFAGLWRLTGADHRFGGYSALVPHDDGGSLLALSDRNRSLLIALPLRTGWQAATLPRVIGKRIKGTKRLYFGFDIEAAVRDPATGSLWLGLEYWSDVVRIDAPARARPAASPAQAHFFDVPETHGWPHNGGLEAMARLNDGRWVMLCEACSHRAEGHVGLIFAGPPGKVRRQAKEFAIVLPPSFDPVDAATLPDGRVLILVRRLVLWPLHFEARIVLADFARFDARRPMPTRELARLDGKGIRENWEGMALLRGTGDHDLRLWLISDANDSAFQETRLLQMRFDPAALAR